MQTTTIIAKVKEQPIKISDIAKFNEVFNEYYPIIGNFLRTKIQNEEEREDVLCDIFRKVATHFDGYNVEKAKINTWIYTIVNNRVIDYYRSPKHNQTGIVIAETDLVNADGETSFDYVGDDNADTDMVNRELRHKIRRAIRSLRPIEKHIAILRFVKEYDYNEIAEILCIPLGSVKATLLRAKESLQLSLKNEYATL